MLQEAPQQLYLQDHRRQPAPQMPEAACSWYFKSRPYHPTSITGKYRSVCFIDKSSALAAVKKSFLKTVSTDFNKSKEHSEHPQSKFSINPSEKALWPAFQPFQKVAAKHKQPRLVAKYPHLANYCILCLFSSKIFNSPTSCPDALKEKTFFRPGMVYFSLYLFALQHSSIS